MEAIHVAVDTVERLAANIIDAITSGRDVWVLDQILQGPDRLQHAPENPVRKTCRLLGSRTLPGRDHPPSRPAFGKVGVTL